MDYNEQIYSIVEIRAFKKGVLNFSFPPEVIRKAISKNSITGNAENFRVLNDSDDADIKETPDGDIGGRYYKVVLQKKIEEISGDYLKELEILKSTPHDYILYPISGMPMLVRTDPSAYDVVYSTASNGEILVSIEAKCINGIQFITD